MLAAMRGDSIPVFVISLARARERRQRIRAMLDSLGVPFTLVDGVDGAALAADEIERNVDSRLVRIGIGRDLQPGEIGCAMAHRHAYAMIERLDRPYALVLEDDAVIDRAAWQVISAIVEDRPPFDLINLQPLDSFIRRRATHSYGRFRVYPAIRAPSSTLAYLVTPRAAAVLAAEPRLGRTADWSSQVFAMRVAAVLPWLAVPSGGSLIGRRDNGKAPMSPVYRCLLAVRTAIERRRLEPIRHFARVHWPPLLFLRACIWRYASAKRPPR
ncbi:MAG: glycosyltransferase family 25 protein [Pseudomonadota bacterium]